MARGDVYVSKYNSSSSVIFYGTILNAKHFSCNKEANEIAKIVNGDVLSCQITISELPPNGA